MEIRFPLILDGATRTQQQKRGIEGDIRTEQWVHAHPEAIQDVQRRCGQSGDLRPHLRRKPSETGGTACF